MEILAVENLNFTYPESKRETLSDISFSVKSGEFVTLCGGTGSGKTTLLRLLKPELTQLGKITGSIRYCGTELSNIPLEQSASEIGYVMQRPEQQIVTDTVLHELSFGLENLGTKQNVMKRKIAETASYFGISQWIDKKTDELSGGQKQLLNLASVMIMSPKLLILDEPTAQLDPVSAEEFIGILKKINRELGVTIIISEHRLEGILPISDKLLIIEEGRKLYYDAPRSAAGAIGDNSQILEAMPASVRIFHMTDGMGECPMDIKEGKEYIEKRFGGSRRIYPVAESELKTRVLSMRNVSFRYSRNEKDILTGVNLDVHENEIFCILGANGSGKTTLLSVTAGLLSPYTGKIEIKGKNIKKYRSGELYNHCLAYLPQDVQTLFLENTVSEELEGADARIIEMFSDTDRIKEMHPYDLSGGEQQLLALAKILSAEPKILLLDEPTKGIDAQGKKRLTAILKKLREDGMTIIAVTHDTEFAAECADRCAMCFSGGLISAEETHRFFSGNSFYTTPTSRMTRECADNVITPEEFAELFSQSDKERAQ